MKLLKYIRTAASTLDICIFTLTCDDIANAILDRHTAGVKVRVICDDDQASSQGSDIGKLKSAGIQVVDDNSQYHMHHKFGIIDGRLLINVRPLPPSSACFFPIDTSVSPIDTRVYPIDTRYLQSIPEYLQSIPEYLQLIPVSCNQRAPAASVLCSNPP